MIDGDVFILSVIVGGERSPIHTAGVEPDGVFSLNWGFVDCMTEKHAIRTIVVVVPERSVIPVSLG